MQWVQEHPEQSVSTDDEDTSNTGTTTDEEEAAAQGRQQQQVNMAGAAGIDYDRWKKRREEGKRKKLLYMLRIRSKSNVLNKKMVHVEDFHRPQHIFKRPHLPQSTRGRAP